MVEKKNVVRPCFERPEDNVRPAYLRKVIERNQGITWMEDGTVDGTLGAIAGDTTNESRTVVVIRVSSIHRYSPRYVLLFTECPTAAESLIKDVAAT